MRKWYKDNNIQDNILTYASSGIIIVAFYFIVTQFGIVKQFLLDTINICLPFICGLVFAFLLSSMCNKIENRLPNIFKQNTKRFIASIISICFLIACIIVFLIVLIPQITTSITQLASNMQSYIVDLSNWLKYLAIKYNISQEMADNLLMYSNQLLNTGINFVQDNLPKIMTVTYTTLTSIGSIIIGIIVALYILIDKESIQRQFRKLGHAFLKDKHYDYVHHVILLSADRFNGFIVGKIIDSIIIGIICFIGMTVMNLDYPVLISFIVGLTNIIPFFGPFIGAVPSMFILLMIEPVQALWFSIWILVLQQLDGNIIGPSILGDSMGLSSMWIMFAIIVGGGFFGIIGMLLGVPTFSVIYILLKEYAEKREAAKITHNE